jgi:hypothetical protein
MDDISIFTDKEAQPTDRSLIAALGSVHKLWKQIHALVMRKYPKAMAEWNYPGKKYGWNYRIKDKKRAIIYMLPRDGYFKVAFVFGEKAFLQVMDSPVSNAIKTGLSQAKKYAEGRGIRIDITTEVIIPDIEKLVDIKLSS